MVDWLIVPRNAALLNLIGFVVGGVGLAATIAGLFIALRQLSAIKTETEATTAAVEAMQFKVASLDVVKECQSATARITEIRSALKLADWESILTSYEELISIFLRLAHSFGIVTAADRDAMIKMTEDMAKICEGVRCTSSDPSSARSLRGQDQALRNFSDIMTRISFLVEKDLRT